MTIHAIYAYFMCCPVYVQSQDLEWREAQKGDKKWMCIAQVLDISLYWGLAYNSALFVNPNFLYLTLGNPHNTDFYDTEDRQTWRSNCTARFFNLPVTFFLLG